jgi:Na+-translocating ferredoxin:NAD+ oxidoreductase RnfG subunit
MKHIIKPAFSLFIIAAIATTALATVRNFTEEPIKNQRRIAQERVKREILPDASVYKEISALKSGSIQGIHECSNEKGTVGFIVELAPEGYSGVITMMAGISSKEKGLVRFFLYNPVISKYCPRKFF